MKHQFKIFWLVPKNVKIEIYKTVLNYKYYVFGHYPSSRPFFKKHNVSETGFCLRPQVKPTQLDPIYRASPYLRNPVSETLCFLKNGQDDG
jgi:hypothetical protein